MSSTDRSTLAQLAAATVIAEIAWAGPRDDVRAAPVVPLTAGEDVVVALPYAERELADALAAAEAVALVASDRRLTLSGWQPLAAVGRMELEHDPAGTRFRTQFVEEELRKYPPSRLLANSLMDRREHWWFMPRLICRLVDVRAVHAVAARGDPAEGVLAWRAADGLRVESVEPAALGAGDLRLRTLSGDVLAGAGDPACLLRHDFSVPDLERRSRLVERGRLEGDALRVRVREGALTLPATPGLLARVRRHRAFARACRREPARGR
jgi:hypothetical protein